MLSLEPSGGKFLHGWGDFDDFDGRLLWIHPENKKMTQAVNRGFRRMSVLYCIYWAGLVKYGSDFDRRRGVAISIGVPETVIGLTLVALEPLYRSYGHDNCIITWCARRCYRQPTWIECCKCNGGTQRRFLGRGELE